MGKIPECIARSPHCRRLLYSISLTVVVILIVLAIELGEAAVPALFAPLAAVVADVVLYSVAGTLFVWLIIGWATDAIRERDEAKARHEAAYQVSHAVANAQDLEALYAIALDLPGRLFEGVATSLAVQPDHAAGWELIGVRNLNESQQASLAALAIGAGKDFQCAGCVVLKATLHRDCPMLAALRQVSPKDSPRQAPAATICLPLARSNSLNVVLHIYLADTKALPSAEALHTLESLAATLAVGMDWAHLRSRETQIVRQVEQAVRARDTSQAMLGQILADIGATFGADSGAVFLASAEHKSTARGAFARWPGEGSSPKLAEAAEQALRTANLEISALPFETGQILAIPLVAEREYLGVMVLSGKFSLATGQPAWLKAVAGMMAMIVRNGQLYAALESQAALEERYRLAREVHDSVGQYLGFLNFKVQQAERSLGRQQLEATTQALREARASIEDLYAELRLTIQNLRLPAEDSPGLVMRMRDMVTSYARGSRLAFSFEAEGEPVLAPETEVQLLRVAREALTNIQRHAQARHAWVRVEACPDSVRLEVKDDGVGFSQPELPPLPESFGLRMMRERVAALGGEFQLLTAPGQGAHLQVTIPLLGAEAPA